MSKPLLSNQLFGLKSDLLLLNIFVREIFPSVLNRLYELGTSLEQLFSEHLLSCFSNLFHTGVLVRIWDLLVFEQAQPNKVTIFLTLLGLIAFDTY